MEPLRERIHAIIVDHDFKHPSQFASEAADAILQAVEEDRAALMAVAERNEDYEEAIERDRDKWRKACEKAEEKNEWYEWYAKRCQWYQGEIAKAEAREAEALRDVAQLHDAAVETEDKLDDLRRRLEEAENHERITHEELGAVLGNDTSLLDGAMRMERRLEEADEILRGVLTEASSKLVASSLSNAALREALAECKRLVDCGEWGDVPSVVDAALAVKHDPMDGTRETDAGGNRV